MLILYLSDTHGKHHELRNLPNADVIIHSGDISFAGSENEVMDFIEWFGALPYTYKIFIAGNHDDCLFEATIDGLPQNCFYLCNSSVIIDGMKFYGIPMFMEDVISGDYDRNIQLIPGNTDILITHQPPYGILDLSANIHYGDLKLLDVVLKTKPRYHLFGHIHGAYGIEKSEQTTFVNASILSEKYELMYEPIMLKIGENDIHFNLNSD